MRITKSTGGRPDHHSSSPLVLMAAARRGPLHPDHALHLQRAPGNRGLTAPVISRKAGMRYAVLNQAAGGLCIIRAGSASRLLAYRSPEASNVVGRVNQNTFLAANGQLAYNMPIT
ncbi:MAG: hypothetical protein MZU79_03920 [Anaerotruncus sp.]|nr:hypothetical protein [Anaerotruncus sp.]